MQAAGGVVPELGEIVAFEDVQDLDDMNAARRRRRHRDDIVAAIGSAHRLALNRRVGLEVFLGDEPAVPLHLIFDQLGNGPLVEPARALGGNGAERLGEVRLAKEFARLVGLAFRMLEIGLARRVGREALVAFLQRIGEPIGDRKAFLGQLDRRRQHLLARQGAIMLQRVEQARHRAGHARRGAAIAGAVPVHIATLVQEHVLGGGGRCGLAVVDSRELLRGGERDQHEAAPADIARLRVRHGKSEAGRDSGIDRIAALLQNVHAHLRRNLFLRRHHPMPGDGGVKPRVVSERRSQRVVRPLCMGGQERGRGRQQRGKRQNQGEASLEHRMHL